MLRHISEANGKNLVLVPALRSYNGLRCQSASLSSERGLGYGLCGPFEI